MTVKKLGMTVEKLGMTVEKLGMTVERLAFNPDYRTPHLPAAHKKKHKGCAMRLAVADALPAAHKKSGHKGRQGRFTAGKNYLM